MAGIDFLGIAKGEQLGRDMNWQDVVRADQQKALDYNAKTREQLGVTRDQAFATQQAGQEAASYLAPLLSYKQRAADAGVNDVEWLLQQRDAIMQDQGFLNKTPEVQQEILKSLGTNATMLAQQYMSKGDVSTAQQILGKFGQNALVNPLDAAIQSNDPDSILAAAGLKADENGMVNVGGQLVPKLEAIAGIASARNAGGVLRPAVDAYRGGVAKTAAQELVDQQKAAALQNNQLTLGLNGYKQDANGVWVSADGKQSYNLSLEGGIVPVAGTAVPGVPGVGGSQTPVTSPLGAAVPATPGAAPGVMPLPSGALPAQPALSAPLTALQQTLKDLPATQSALQNTQTALAQAIQGKNAIERTMPDGSKAARPGEEVNYRALLEGIRGLQENEQKLQTSYGDLLRNHRELNGQLTAQTTAATGIGDELIRGYTNIGLDAAKAADFTRKYPAQLPGIVAALQAEIKRVEARSLAAATADEKAALLAYAQRVSGAILNLNRKP